MALALESQVGAETLQRLLQRTSASVTVRPCWTPMPRVTKRHCRICLPPLTPGQTARVKALRAVASDHASQLGFATELLARRKDVEQCLRSYVANAELSEHFLGWRDGILGDQFRQILSG